ncbi:hypothetical protein Sme01_40530 [Sphaerisporangium melleum]|uniref:Uncharacterized protein n=1 Tax=Sphaerisporangium melleum TaxID=321316 RepID=A0A917RCA6_9ACTN|nr:hypothetical protein [Sphaerisporangium melleum]GGL00572.1 hypothetical protein GCM10007964_48330 [Sphaerisporangium melleum]GII71577.1 hypothetical protein Sme01_40530 [Sphaerisporangium melleum]
MPQKATAAPKDAKRERANAGRGAKRKQEPEPRSAHEEARRGRPRRPGVELPLLGRVEVPPPDRVAFYVALSLLAAFEVIEWPLALVIGAGHFLAAQDFSKALRGVGQAAETV